MNKKYKEYFDNISPDKKLVDETAQKMLEELNNKSSVKKFNIKPFAAAAACLAVTASAVWLAPDLKKEITDDTTVTSRYAAELPEETAEFTSEISETSVTAVSNSDNKINTTAVTTVPLSETVKKQEESYTYDSITSGSNPAVASLQTTAEQSSEHSVSQIVSVQSSDTYSVQTESAVASQTTAKQNFQTTIIQSTTASEVQTTEANQNTEPVTAQSSEQITSYPIPVISVTIPFDPESPISAPDNPVVTTASASAIIARPGASGSNSSGMLSPEVPPEKSDESFYESVNSGGINVAVNYAYDYSLYYSDSVQKINIKGVEELLGKSFMPAVLQKEYPDVYGASSRNGGIMRNGFYFVFGEESILERVGGRFAAMTVSDEYPKMGYEFSFLNPVSTCIDENEIIFGTYGELKNVYFCSFEKNNLFYKFLFKGYDISEIFDIIKSI